MTELYSLSKKKDEEKWGNRTSHHFPYRPLHYNRTMTLTLGEVEIVVLNLLRADGIGEHLIQIINGPAHATGQTELKPDNGQTYYEFAGKYKYSDMVYRLCHAAGKSREH